MLLWQLIEYHNTYRYTWGECLPPPHAMNHTARLVGYLLQGLQLPGVVLALPLEEIPHRVTVLRHIRTALSAITTHLRPVPALHDMLDHSMQLLRQRMNSQCHLTQVTSDTSTVMLTEPCVGGVIRTHSLVLGTACGTMERTNSTLNVPCVRHHLRSHNFTTPATQHVMAGMYRTTVFMLMINKIHCHRIGFIEIPGMYRWIGCTCHALCWFVTIGNGHQAFATVVAALFQELGINCHATIAMCCISSICDLFQEHGHQLPRAGIGCL